MKKLTVLVAVMLVVTLLAGCWVLPESKLDYIEVEPKYVTLNTGITEQLKVIAFYEDLTYADVTLNCDYVSSDTEVATVNDEGLILGVKPEGPTLSNIGKATILVTHTQHNAWTGMRVRTAEVEVEVLY